MNLSEAAKKLKIKPESLHAATTRNAIKYSIVNGHKEFALEDLNEYQNREGKGNRTGKFKILYPASESRPAQKQITDDFGNETILSQCKLCGGYKLDLYQNYTCAHCLNYAFRNLIHIVNKVRGMVA